VGGLCRRRTGSRVEQVLREVEGLGWALRLAGWLAGGTVGEGVRGWMGKVVEEEVVMATAMAMAMAMTLGQDKARTHRHFF
jgi:hypothetical protein